MKTLIFVCLVVLLNACTFTATPDGYYDVSVSGALYPSIYYGGYYASPYYGRPYNYYRPRYYPQYPRHGYNGYNGWNNYRGGYGHPHHPHYGGRHWR